jgi:DNA-binding transcriptional LysR family regulator
MDFHILFRRVIFLEVMEYRKPAKSLRNLDVTRLRQLAMIVEHRSFSKAAEVLGVSQPALSKNIRSLERALGVSLLERGRFGAIPTPFGLTLARHADSIDAELRTAADELSALKSARIGSTCIGCGPSEATRLLPMALNHLRARSPDIGVTVLYGLNEALTPMVKHGEIDFALSSIPPRCDDPDLKQIRLHEDRAAVFARSGHPLLSKKAPLQASMLVNQVWVLARSRELERRALDDLFAQAELQPPTAAIETTSAVLMKTVVMQSDALTFLPREMVYWEERAGLMAPLKLISPAWRRFVGITQRARTQLNPAAQALLDALRSCATEFT